MAGSERVAERYAGARVLRGEDPRLLTGRGTFVDDVVRPAMLQARFVRSPLARARILGVDVSGALALEGVQAVFLAEDLNPDVREAWYTITGRDVPDSPRPPLAEGEVRFVGDPVALVIATDRYIAEDAAELVAVDYEPLVPVPDYVTAQDAIELVYPEFPRNTLGELSGGAAVEDLALVFAGAPWSVRETIVQQAAAAVPIETRGMVAEWVAPSGEMTIWAATQSPHEVRMFCARLLGLPEHRVRVIMRDTGGGFGQKVLIDEAWRVLLDIERIAPCVPGATLTARDGDRYQGRVKVKLGPISLSYHGSVTFVSIDEASRIVVLQAAGREVRGGGMANAVVTCRLTARDDATDVLVDTDLTITGKPAQFGRGALAEVAGTMIAQFATNLAAEMAPAGPTES